MLGICEKAVPDGTLCPLQMVWELGKVAVSWRQYRPHSVPGEGMEGKMYVELNCAGWLYTRRPEEEESQRIEMQAEMQRLTCSACVMT